MRTADSGVYGSVDSAPPRDATAAHATTSVARRDERIMNPASLQVVHNESGWGIGARSARALRSQLTALQPTAHGFGSRSNAIEPDPSASISCTAPAS